MGDVVIIAPHCDDECIGTWEILSSKKPIIIYDGDTPSNRREAAIKLKEHTEVKVQLFQKSIPLSLINNETIFYFPDPIYETHPLHRSWGFMGEQLARNGFDVIFYNTIMNAPYIHECKNSDGKLALLNTVYPDQKSLWEYDHKYFLFEGYSKWLF